MSSRTLSALSRNRGSEAALGELMVSACMNEFGAGTLGKDGADFSVFFIEGIIEYYWDLPYAPRL